MIEICKVDNLLLKGKGPLQVVAWASLGSNFNGFSSWGSFAWL